MMLWYVQMRWQPAGRLAERWNALRRPAPVTAAESEPLHRAGVLDIGSQHLVMAPVIEHIRRDSAPDERVFDFSNQALWLFFADRRAASRYFLAAYASHPSMQREVIADMERHSVNLVIRSSGTWFEQIDGVPQTVRHPLIAEYLEENFEPAGRTGSFLAPAPTTRNSTFSLVKRSNMFL